MANPDRWRDPLPNEVIIEMNRWQIEDMSFEIYKALCEWPNRVTHAPDYHGDFVQWAIPEDQWAWLLLCYPELGQARHVDRSPRPYVAFPNQPKKD